jgi:hypothetical protein
VHFDRHIYLFLLVKLVDLQDHTLELLETFVPVLLLILMNLFTVLDQESLFVLWDTHLLESKKVVAVLREELAVKQESGWNFEANGEVFHVLLCVVV